MIYLEVILWWIVVPTITIVAGCGIWNVCTYCWREYQHALIDDRKVGAGRSRGLGTGHSDSLTGADTPGSRSGSRASCVGRTGRIESQVTFPREWVLTSSRPYDQENDAA